MLPIGEYYRWAVTSLRISVNNISSAVLMYLQYRENQYGTIAFISMFCTSLREELLYGFFSWTAQENDWFFAFSFFKKDLSWKYPDKTVVSRQKYTWVPALLQEGWLKEGYLGFFDGWWLLSCSVLKTLCRKVDICMKLHWMKYFFLPLYCYQLSGNQGLI